MEHSNGTDWDLFTSTILKTYVPAEIPKFKTEVQLIKALYENSKIYLCSVWLHDLKKRNDANDNENPELSASFRNQGNETLKRGPKYNRIAAIQYTKAIYKSADDSIDLALAHANRSVPLMAMRYYAEAYLDCAIAKNTNYPKEKLEKILHRQACCAIELNDTDKLVTILDELASLKHRLAKFNDAKYKEFWELSTKLEPTNKTSLLDVIYNEKSLLEKSSSKCGRYILAGEDLEFGDSITTEKAFAFIPVYELSDHKNIRFDCQNCAKVNVFPFPCNKCHRAAYCSAECKRSHDSIHGLECSGYKFNLWDNIGIAHLAFRTFVAGHKDISEKFSQTDSHVMGNAETVFNKIIDMAKYEKFQYGDVLKLVTNFDKMDKQDVLIYGLTAVMLTMYLKEYTSFFEQTILNSPKDSEILVASIIFRHMGQMVCNGHAIVELYTFHDLKAVGEWKYGEPAFGMFNEHFKSRRIFTAIYPRISVLNHSCDPNIANRFNNLDLTIFANRDIKYNEQVFNCYGPNYKLMQKEERQNLLRQQYCFDCECSRCLAPQSSDDFEFYVCRNSDCRTAIYVVDDAVRYWYLKDELPQIVCPKCTIQQDFNWFLEMSLLFDKNMLDSYVEIFRIYNINKVHLSQCHELKEITCDRIISMLIPVVERINVPAVSAGLLNIVLENIQLKKMKYGELSGEYLHASTFLLDYMAKMKQVNLSLKIDYKSILAKCTLMLSSQAKLCYDNYINKYIK